MKENKENKEKSKVKRSKVVIKRKEKRIKKCQKARQLNLPAMNRNQNYDLIQKNKTAACGHIPFSPRMRARIYQEVQKEKARTVGLQPARRA